jgi:hypothetical protein
MWSRNLSLMLPCLFFVMTQAQPVVVKAPVPTPVVVQVKTYWIFVDGFVVGGFLSGFAPDKGNFGLTVDVV